MSEESLEQRWIIAMSMVKRLNDELRSAQECERELFTELQMQRISLMGRITEKQRVVLTLAAAGLGYKEIAARLHISERTVKYHATKIMTRAYGSSKEFRSLKEVVQRELVHA